MDKKDIKFNWDQMTLAYEGFVDSPKSYSRSIELPNVKLLLPELENKNVIDLGCGTGRFSFVFEEYKAKKIIAIDLSSEMINRAQSLATERKSKIEFLQGDIENLDFITDESIDFVFSSTVLHFLETPKNVLQEISRILKPKGICILSVIHPLYSALYPLAKDERDFPTEEDWQVRYLNKGMRAYVQPWIEYNPEIENFLTYSYHHTMADYINSFIEEGLAVKLLKEPMPPEEWKTKHPKKYHAFLNTPTYAIFKLEKTN